MVLRRSRRCILRRGKFAPETPSAVPPRLASAPAASPSPAATTAPAKTSTAISARPSAPRTILKSSAIGTIAAARWTRNCRRKCSRRRRTMQRRNRFTRKRFQSSSDTRSRSSTRTRRFHINRLDDRRSSGIRGENLPALFFHLLGFILDGRDDVIQLLNFFHEVADVQEGVAIEANFHEGRLHAWQHARYFAFVDASD